MKPTMKKHVGKGSQEEILPHRNAMQQLTKGDPTQRSLNNYAKKTPSGEGALNMPPAMFSGYGGGY